MQGNQWRQMGSINFAASGGNFVPFISLLFAVAGEKMAVLHNYSKTDKLENRNTWFKLQNDYSSRWGLAINLTANCICSTHLFY